MLKTNIGWHFFWGGPLARVLMKFVGALITAMLVSANAFANVIESIDIARVEDKAQITIRFATEIQYLRHGPEDEGKFLRIFFRVSKPGFSESDVMQETLRSPPSDLMPRFSLAYPELVNGMLISFAKTTKYTVKPGGDARSILIFVPLTPEQIAKAAAAKPDKVAVTEPKPTPPVVSKPAVPPAAEKQKPKVADPKRATVIATTPPAVQAAAPVEATPAPEIVQIPDAEKPEAPAPLAPERVEELSRGFLAEAQAAFGRGDYPTTINRLNRVLGLPNSAQTESAQALMGEVREKNGEIAKARAEYELYLKLYPNGAEAPRIKQRLAGLPTTEATKRSTRIARDDKPAEWLVFGSVSSYYFTGRSQQDSGPKQRDQQSLVSSISLNARLRDAATDTRFVFRDTDSRNFLNTQRNYNRVYSAYAERTDRDLGYFFRVGRQNPTGGGVLERFDGLTGGYNLGSDWRINAVAGNAVEFKSAGFSGFNIPVDKKFYGGSIELLPQIGRPGVNLYAIEQTLNGYLNRRAVGAEVRYFDGQFSGFGTLDYDLLYKGTNIAALQGNYSDPWGNNYFISYDYRNSPSYSLSNALFATSASGITTVPDLISAFGISQARTLVVDSTPATTSFGTGVTIPVGERWQFGLDYRMSSTTGTNTVLPLNQVCKSLGFNALDPNDPICVGGPLGDTPVSQLCAGDSYDPNNNTCRAGQNAQGRLNTYTAQAIGTNLFVTNGVGVVSVSFSNGPDLSAQNYGINYIYPFTENWRLESNLRYTNFKSENGNTQTNLSPSLKLAHQWRASLFLEGEIGYSDQKSSGTNQGQNKREYLYLGMRWDYR